MSEHHPHDHRAQGHEHEHEHGRRTVERRADVVVVGASDAALAAAAELGRRGRSAIVIDDDGEGPAGGRAVDLEDVRRHGGEVLRGRATGIGADDGQHRVGLTGGHAVVGRRLVVVPGAVLGGGSDAVAPGSTVAEGTTTGRALADELDAEDRTAAAVPANQADWDHRYAGEQIWSGNPNGSLVDEVSDLAPGRALDVGAGEGGDALWLAERGWAVTANDVSQRALDRIGAAARARGLRVELLRADANELDPFPQEAFDLVTAHYASIPRRADDRAVANLLAAVAPGGTLLVVGHDLGPMRTPVDVAQGSRAFDADAYVRVDDVAAALPPDGWEVEEHGLRPRPPGAASSHHVDDVVLRARRRP